MSSGFFEGIGRGIADAGERMGQDALEANRQQRLEEARIRQEQRAAKEHDRRLERETLLKHGQGAMDDPRGLLARERDAEARSRFGAGANLEDGTLHLERNRAMEDHHEQEDAGVGYSNRRAQGAQAAQGTWAQENHPEKGWGEVNSVTKQWRPIGPGTGSPHAKGAKGAEGSGGPGATELNHIRGMVSTMFGGSLDAMGNMLLPPENRESGMEVYGRAEALNRNGMPLGQAVYLSYKAVTGIKDEDAARKAAEAEANTQGLSGSFLGMGGGDRREFIDRRAQEIMAESRQYEGSFDEIMGRSGGGLLGGSAAPGVAASGQPSAPSGEPKYPDGTRLSGPGGKIYVVRDGKPVLAE